MLGSERLRMFGGLTENSVRSVVALDVCCTGMAGKSVLRRVLLCIPVDATL